MINHGDCNLRNATEIKSVAQVDSTKLVIPEPGRAVALSVPEPLTVNGQELGGCSAVQEAVGWIINPSDPQGRSVVSLDSGCVHMYAMVKVIRYHLKLARGCKQGAQLKSFAIIPLPN